MHKKGIWVGSVDDIFAMYFLSESVITSNVMICIFWFDADALDHDKISALRIKTKLKLKNRSIETTSKASYD